MPTYYAPDLENRITNTEPILGVNSQQKNFEPTATYAYNVVQAGTWAGARLGDATNVGNSFFIKNTFITTRYNLTRTGVQYNASLPFIPIGSYIIVSIDSFTFPQNINSFKIRVYKGRSQSLTGVIQENRIPQSSRYTPYSGEIEIIENQTKYFIFLNSLATSDLIAGNGLFNFFILGEFDYNNIAPTQLSEITYSGLNPNMALIVFD
jgi:hypothetical protein